MIKDEQEDKYKDLNLAQDQMRSDSDIFELLKEIKYSETNSELMAYFQFARFYGLLDPRNKKSLEELESKEKKFFRIITFGVGITILTSYIFYKRNYIRISFYSLIVGSLPIGYMSYITDLEINYALLKIKDDYIYRVDRFFKEEKNPSLLNPNFIVEDLIDPNLRKYQEILKAKNNKMY